MKSIAYISDFDFKNGSVRVFCVNWSEFAENERNFADNLSVSISPDYFFKWLNAVKWILNYTWSRGVQQR